MSLGCDNLLCDALGRAPSCRLVIWVRNETQRDETDGEVVANTLETMWRKYCQTEVVEVRRFFFSIHTKWVTFCRSLDCLESLLDCFYKFFGFCLSFALKS